MAPTPPPVLTRCRRFGVSSFPADEFESGPGGKNVVTWSQGHGVCAYHERSKEYYRLAEGSQLNELGASVDEIAEQLRLMISGVQTQTSDGLTDLAAQISKANADRDKQLRLRDAAVDKTISAMEGRLKALEGRFERFSEFEKSSREQLARHEDELKALDDIMIDRFSGRDQRVDDLEVSIKKQFSVTSQRLADLTTLLGQAAERIGTIEAATDEKLLEFHGRVEECVSTQEAKAKEMIADVSSDLSSISARVDQKIAEFEEAEQTRLTLGTAIDEKLGDLKHLLGSKVDAAYVQDIACRCDEDRQRLGSVQKGVQLLMSEMVKWRHTIEFLQEKVGGAASPNLPYPRNPAPPGAPGAHTAQGVPPPSMRPISGLGSKPKWDKATTDTPIRSLRGNVSLPDIRQSPGGSSARR